MSKSIKRILWYLIILLISICALFSKKLVFIKNIDHLVSKFSYPILYSVGYIQTKLGDFVMYATNLHEAHLQNILLKQDKILLEYELHKITNLKQENNFLKQQLNYVNQPDYKFITAKIAIKNLGEYGNSAIVLAGTRDGVEVGQAVINQQGLAGKISKTYENCSVVTLITDLNSKVPVTTYSHFQKAIVSGYNSKWLKLSYLEDKTKISKGEIVITANDGDHFPEGIEVGKIESIDSENVIAKPTVNFSELNFVRILLK